ncbi:hypothetical protein FSP39_009168 [Pinctada imbricata]|uniref:Protein SHQ1 homolog n=1 Tax=Pinctada imbricata TaxID=66713 RepID=A0AA88YIL2_PINIB|nr:hypothetical protein FSP39_009168 [Pinctada imbricata]
MLLKIGYWNVHGLSDSKLEDHCEFFNNVHRQFDVVCFSETMNDSTRNLPGFQSCFVLNAKRHKKRGRKSGGLLVFAKSEISKNITKTKETEYSLWLKIDNLKLFDGTLQKPLFLCFTYIQPSKSKDLSEEIFLELKSDIERYQKLGETLICGDFNARTGKLKDYIDHDDIGESFVDCPLPTVYLPDTCAPREQLDKTCNSHGILLTDMCKTLNLRILNGRFLGDSQGYYTFSNQNGSSTVDYMLASNNIYNSILYFNVLPPNEISDHCIITTGIQTHMDRQNSIHTVYENVHKLKGRFEWSDNCKEAYLIAMSDDESVSKILELDSLLKDPTQMDVNMLSDKLNNIYIKAAYKTVQFRKVHHRKKKIKSKPWITHDINRLRKEVRSLGKKLHDEPNNCFTLASYCKAKREFNKLRKKLRKDYYEAITGQINNLDSKSANEFWKLINKHKSSSTNTDVNPTEGMKLFVDHYKSLLNDKEVSPNNADELLPLNIDNNKPLDFPFTHKETKEAIKELKCNKSAGIDLVINEFIKASCNILTPTLTNLFNKILSTGEIPKEWNLAFIKSLYKSGNPDDPGNYRGEEDIQNDVTKDEGEDIENFDWHIEQHPFQEVAISLDAPKYGFANQRSGVFNILKDEVYEVVDIKDPDSVPACKRRQLRLEAENAKFDPEYYLGDFYEDSAIKEVMKYEPQWSTKATGSLNGFNSLFKNFLITDIEFTEEENETMRNLPRKEYNDSETALYLGLVDILCAYAYNVRTTEGENNVESAWTVCKLSSTLSWLESFEDLEAVASSFMRRSLCYPLYRNWNLSMKVLQDTAHLLCRGKQTILRILLEIHSLFSESYPRYILNDLYVKDYSVWIQTTR